MIALSPSATWSFSHIVLHEENLSGILYKYNIKPIYGKNGSIKKTININNILNPDKLKPGMKIILPCSNCHDKNESKKTKQKNIGSFKINKPTINDTRVILKKPKNQYKVSIKLSVSGSEIVTVNKSNGAKSNNYIGHNIVRYSEDSEKYRHGFFGDYVNLTDANNGTKKGSVFLLGSDFDYKIFENKKIQTYLNLSITQKPYLLEVDSSLALRPKAFVETGLSFDISIDKDVSLKTKLNKGVSLSGSVNTEKISIDLKKNSFLLKNLYFESGLFIEQNENKKFKNKESGLSFGVGYEF